MRTLAIAIAAAFVCLATVAVAQDPWPNMETGPFPNAEPYCNGAGVCVGGLTLGGDLDLVGNDLFGSKILDPDTYIHRTGANEWTVVAGGATVAVCTATKCTFLAGDFSDGDITNVGDIKVDSITADDTSGGITIGGTGATSTESVKVQFGETANKVAVSTTTGVTDIDVTGIDINTTTEMSAENLVSTDDADVNDSLVCGDFVVDEAVGIINMSGTTSNTVQCASGTCTLKSTKAAGNQEDVTVDLETTANTVTWGSGTGATAHAFPASIASKQILYTPVATITPSGANPTQNVDWTAGHMQTIDLHSATGCTVTLTFTAPSAANARLRLRVIQANPACSITWPATAKWPSATAPTLTATNDALDVVEFTYDGTNFNGNWDNDIR